ncbi:phage tail protein [Nitrospina sp. 32_T5]|uniref:phage tail protein n=1 Tax=unclassified Nitrospina TaxID=2638683 RepID=UPI003F9EB6FB
MTTTTRKENGQRLFDLLPAVYRTNDNSDHNLNQGRRERYNGDLGLYLDACGELLDQVQHTLEQRLADLFPDNPLEADRLACQEWLLPYFAKLLDVRLVSPHARGRREEVANAVSWRQRKGTLRVAELLAEAVGQMEVELQEGWKRVATTPRIDKPRLRATALGYSGVLDEEHYQKFPQVISRHPALPAVTVDFRHPSGARQTEAHNPAARVSKFSGQPVPWRPVSLHGGPCHADSYEDVSRRTVDMRSPDWKRGHYHPKRMLFYYPPPAGFFDKPVQSFKWADHADFLEVTEYYEGGNKVIEFMRKEVEGVNGDVWQVEDAVTLTEPAVYRFSDLQFVDTLTIENGFLEMERCTVKELTGEREDLVNPVLTVRDGLLENVTANKGLVQLEYTTVLKVAKVGKLQASDSIFIQPIQFTIPAASVPGKHCIRFSRLQPGQSMDGVTAFKNTRDTVHLFSSSYGERGCGVLHPATPDTVTTGAEEGGEMGAYHHQFLVRQRQAMLDKLQDYIPVGMQAALIPDPRLLVVPPNDTNGDETES